MKIRTLKMECDEGALAEVWATCHCQQDCDDLIAWLRIAKGVMAKWDKINAKTSRAPKAAADKNEDTQRRKVQGEPQGAIRANG